jgi:UDP-glucose 4-epimerase
MEKSQKIRVGIKMKILITGNSGYIGSHLTQLLGKRTDLELYGLDNNIPHIPIKNFFYHDITKPHEFKHLKQDIIFDCVIHLAAKVSVSHSVKDPILYYVTNTVGTLNILKNIATKRFINASTGAASDMISPYGISKRAAEEIVDQYCKENSIPFTTFRFYNVTGSDGTKPTNPDGLMWNLMSAQKTGVFNLFGDDYNTLDGSAVRDYTHVNEICNALEQAIDRSTNQIENLGHGVGTTVKQMINLYKKVNNCEFDVHVCPRRVGDLERSVLDKPSPFMQQLYTMKDLLKV